MKRIVFLACLLACSTTFFQLNAQTDTYSTSAGEMIFSWGETPLSKDFMARFPLAKISDYPVRFTVFFHVQQFWHLDLNDNLGFFTGLAIRNIGMISDEFLPKNYETAATSDDYFNAKIIRRTYSLGLPLAVKLGSFSNHLYIYGGGEIEWAFHMKEKWWDQHSRDGSKTKTTTWWPNQLNTLQPSAFIGAQFPGGINLKMKYYLDNFLNHDYDVYKNATTPGQAVSDLTKYESSQLVYVSLSFQFQTSQIMKQFDSDKSVASNY
ncbi:MAG: hypothetical protein IPM71_10930 [Bacteroidota bacterium]|nr:MAG: hypothetical protein IPM71_10930 [Bacteroidota bacterium]